MDPGGPAEGGGAVDGAVVAEAVVAGVVAPAHARHVSWLRGGGGEQLRGGQRGGRGHHGVGALDAGLAGPGHTAGAAVRHHLADGLGGQAWIWS